jgi:transaldolase/transaldolase/glucose-6-phosphate isomerase
MKTHPLLFGLPRYRQVVEAYLAGLEGRAAREARDQRLLWASTGAKNPAYSDVKYVEALIGPNTINTVPLETLNAYRDHGNPEVRIESDVAGAARVLRLLPSLGIGIDPVTQQLEDEGIAKFIQPFDKLMKALEQKRAEWK